MARDDDLGQTGIEGLDAILLGFHCSLKSREDVIGQGGMRLRSLEATAGKVQPFSNYSSILNRGRIRLGLSAILGKAVGRK